MKRGLLIALGLGACQLFPAPDSQHFYACAKDSDCTVSGQVCLAALCQPEPDAGDAGPPDAGDAGPPDGGDAGSVGLKDAGSAALAVALVTGGPINSLASGMDDFNVYAAGRTIWRLAPSTGPSSSFTDRGEALADAVELGQSSTLGYRALRYGEAGGDAFAAVARHDLQTGDDVAIYVDHANRWQQLAAFPTLRDWALVADPNLGPLVYALVATDAGADLIEIDEDGGQTDLVPPLDAGWACSALTGAPDSGTLYVAMSDQNTLYTQALAIENLDGGPTTTLQLPLGVIPLPNPGGCRQVGPTAWALFRGEAGFHSQDLLYWDGTSGIATLESIDLVDTGSNDPLEAFDGGAPLALTVATNFDFLVASQGNVLYGQSTVSGLFTPGPYLSELPEQITGLAATSQQILAETLTGLYDVTMQAAIDGGGEPLPAEKGFDGQAPFGYAAGPHALFALGGSDRSFPSIYRDTGLGFTPFAAPVGQDCGSLAPIDDDDTLVVCDGGAMYLVDGGANLLGTAPGQLTVGASADGGVWVYSQTTPVQVWLGDAGFQSIAGTQSPVWSSPLSGDFRETYALDNTDEVVLLNGPGTPVQLSATPISGAGVVDPVNGTRFVGADSQGVIWVCTIPLLSASLNCEELCAAADTNVTLQFEAIGLLDARLWILSHIPLPGVDDLAVLPPVGQSHLAEVTNADLQLAGQLGDPLPACPLVDLTFPNATTPEALLNLGVAPQTALGTAGTIYVQGSRHLLTLSR